MMLALILIYLFSLLGFIFFRDDFLTNIQRKKYSIQYRRSMKTMTMTRMSIIVVVRDCLIDCFCVSYSSTNTFFSFFNLAATIPSIIENGYCTKDNCSNLTATSLTNQSDEIGTEQLERACDTLFMCIVTTLNKGLRNGGGIGDVLRQPSNKVRFPSCTDSCFYLMDFRNHCISFELSTI